MVKIHIKSLKKNPKIKASELKALALKVLKEEKPSSPVEISVTLVGDEYITKLNQKYKNLNRPTDVLAFPVGKPHLPQEAKAGDISLGDIYISVERALAQIPKNETLKDEVSRLLIHGILHLLGYKHGKQMIARQENYLYRSLQ